MLTFRTSYTVKPSTMSDASKQRLVWDRTEPRAYVIPEKYRALQAQELLEKLRDFISEKEQLGQELLVREDQHDDSLQLPGRPTDTTKYWRLCFEGVKHNDFSVIYLADVQQLTVRRHPDFCVGSLKFDGVIHQLQHFCKE
jgi:hypothetical protein